MRKKFNGIGIWPGLFCRHLNSFIHSISWSSFCVTCQVSRVRCQVSPYFFLSGGPSRWRVCYQPRLVLTSHQSLLVPNWFTLTLKIKHLHFYILGSTYVIFKIYQLLKVVWRWSLFCGVVLRMLCYVYGFFSFFFQK